MFAPSAEQVTLVDPIAGVYRKRPPPIWYSEAPSSDIHLSGQKLKFVQPQSNDGISANTTTASPILERGALPETYNGRPHYRVVT